jgi:hypothetical protein
MRWQPLSPGEDDMTMRIGHEDRDLGGTDRRLPGQRPGPAIFIVGCCRDDAFVPAEVLICADSLGAEEAIRVWLAGRNMRLSSSNVEDVSTTSGPAEGSGA